MISNAAWGLLGIAVLAASPAFAQTRSWEGAVFPVQFDSQGVRHWYTYGYYGPFAPPLSEPGRNEVRDQAHPSRLQVTKRPD
jgi:hypothetical protein